MRVNCLSLFKLTVLGFCIVCFAVSALTKEENALDRYVPILLKEQRAAGAGVAVNTGSKQQQLIQTRENF